MVRGSVFDRVAVSRGEAAAALALLVAMVVYAVNDGYWLDRLSYDGVLVGASIAAWVGAERAPRGSRLVPRLIALGVSLTALGDLLWDLLDFLGRPTNVSVADPAWFASYVALCGAVWVVLARSRPGGRPDAGFLVDALTVVVVSVLVFWHLAIGSILAQDGLSTLAKVVWSAYPVLDAVLLAIVARVLLSGRGRRALDPGFALGVGVWLLSDTATLVAHHPAALLLIELGWMVAPVLLARAVWRVRLEDGPAAEEDVRHRWRVSLLIAIAPLAVPPALEVVAHLDGAGGDPWVLATGSTALLALAFVRTARLMRSEERHVRELVAARDAALDASRAKSMFVATMSHEIRTPLTTLVGAMEMLEEGDLDDEQTFLVDRMRRATTRLRGLVEDVLDFSAIEAGRLELDSRPFDLHRVLDELLDVYRPVADRAGLRLEWHRDADVPSGVVGDALRLQQVLGNLLDNAVKFTPSGSVGLRVATVGTEPTTGGTRVLFSVTDTGVGIPSDRLAAVFESFTQADGSPTRPYEGSGLGLTISRRLVEAMGGAIEVRSAVGTGSTLEVSVALRRSGVAALG
ncbi:hypothetical protein KDN32_11685 [Nocardioides sp. J2M5]|uniref:ATP-binding protein n=1 Tax=Nocardioides palaemonis TaxID=2829810 RepID=UPI001BA87EA9|nr:ATP-binding protein [Nocardioides palaemonis]MBS2938404.1 hypothetical protein [Nocardioides palaemonis]